MLRQSMFVLAVAGLVAGYWITQTQTVARDSEGFDPAMPLGKKVRVDLAAVDGPVSKFTIDASRHCVFLADTQGKPRDGVLRIELEKGVTYSVHAAGEAYMSEETGSDADPFPGVVLFYGTDGEDGYAIQTSVLKSEDSIQFRTPWRINNDDKVFVTAFFLDHWSDSPNRGSCTLTISEAPRPAAAEDASSR